MKLIILPLLFVLMMSAIIAGGLYFIFHINFWALLAITFSVLMIIGHMWNIFLELKTRIQIAEIQNQEALINSYQNINIHCAYCSSNNVVGVILNSDNTFKCINCNSVNKIMINTRATRTTEPVIADEVIDKVFKSISETESNG